MKCFKHIIIGILGLIIGGSALTVSAQLRYFISEQLAPDPDNGECLSTDGSKNIWSSSCGSGGGGGGSQSPIATTTSNVLGLNNLYSIEDTDIWTIGSNSTTTAQAYFDPNLNVFSIGNVIPPQLSGFGAGYYPVQVSQDTNDVTGISVSNRSSGIMAASGLFFENDETSLGGIGLTETNYGGLIFSGSQWDGISLGLGALTPNSIGLFQVSGDTIIGAATSSPTCDVGNTRFHNGADAFSGGTPNLIISCDGNLGIATSTPKYKLQISSASSPQIGLSDGSNSTVHWTFRNSSGNLTIASSSPSTFEANTTPSIELKESGTIAFSVGSSTPVSLGNNVSSFHGSIFIGRQTGISLANSTSTFDGGINTLGATRSGDYYSGDGTQGFTGTCTLAGITSITVKDGLITSCQ